MSAIGQHVMLRLRNGRIIANTPALRRIAARVILEKGKDYGLIAFALADTHGHLQTPDTRALSIECGRSIALSLGRRLGL